MVIRLENSSSTFVIEPPWNEMTGDVLFLKDDQQGNYVLFHRGL